MLRLLVDQDFDHDILRGLARRVSNLDVLTAFEIGMSEADDLELLSRAAREGRVLVTHDRRTMPHHVAGLMSQGETTAGVFIVLRTSPLHQILEDLELLLTCSESHEWENVVRYVPL
jgi:hypothetical protein